MQRRWNEIDVDKYRKQATEAAEVAREAAERAADAAGKAARTAKDWAEPRIETSWSEAKEWAAPRAEQAFHTAAKKAKPYVRKAGTKAEQWVDVAHGAIVGAAIPAVLSAFDRAAQEEEDYPERRGGNTWAKVLIPVLIAGAAGAALVIWAKRDPGRDEWAGDDDDWEFNGEDDFSSKLRRDVNRAADATAAAAKKAADAVAVAAGAVAEQAGPMVDKAKEQAAPYVDKAVVAASSAAAKARDAAAPVVEKAREAATPVVEKAKATAVTEAERLKANVEAARHRAAVGIAETLDDAEDVWEDEGGPLDDGTTPAAVKKPRAPRKPAAPKE